MQQKLEFDSSFSTLGCPDLGWEALCELARRFAIRFLEIRALGGSLDIPMHLEERFVSPDKWAAAVAEAGMHICGFSTSLKLVGAKDGDREAFLSFIPWAEAVGGVPLRVFDGGSVEAGLSDGKLDEALQLIVWWRQLRQQNNWASDIIIETHDSLARSEPILQLQAALGDHPVDLLWDTHHTWKKGGEAVEATWAQISQWVTHVHVKDSTLEPSARHPFTYVVPGSGVFPLKATLRLLQAAGYNRIVSLEWEKLWHPYLGDISDALAAMQTCLQRIDD